jgi:arginyl-tRNA--protein-N-Asp/Glu arginylyltransferase
MPGCNVIRPAQATSEQYALFNRYLSWRHGEGEMAGMGLPTTAR